MEELVGLVADKDVADFLREALACYGAGAHRACVVLTYIALFDSLRRKLNALAPVNGIAKSISDEIEPLAAAQKVFETPLIHRLKGARIVTQLEAQILEQLANQRNKAAHPSGHFITAEEARFFSEAIRKFITQPIRETSYVVESVLSRLADENFFPSENLRDRKAILQHELANLDEAAKPYLISKLAESFVSPDETIRRNARTFAISLASMKNPVDRKIIIKKIIDPRSSDEAFKRFIFLLISADPEILKELEQGTMLRVRVLLLNQAKVQGISTPYSRGISPAGILGKCVRTLGEDYVLSELKDYAHWVVNQPSYAPELVVELPKTSILFQKLFQKYVDQASSSQWSESNPFAYAVEALDKPLADRISDEQALQLIAAIVRGAHWKGHGPAGIVNDSFNSIPLLKAKAKSFTIAHEAEATKVLKTQHVDEDCAAFIAEHLE
jgi:hypothetical protein